MRKIPIVAAVVALALTLSGCSLLSRLPLPFFPNGAAPSASAAPAGDLEVGACLEGMIGADSNRDSIVSCDSAHRFEVTAITEWPEMDEFIADDPQDAWDRLHTSHELEDGDPVDEYYDWAFAECQLAAMKLAGIDHVEVEGHTAADLWLHLGSTSGVDLSLASRQAFIAGDHRTVCSAAWYDYDSGSPKIVEFPTGVRFSDVNTAQLPTEERECWDIDYLVVDCDSEHVAQVVVDFAGLEAFGPEVITRIATGESTEADWVAAGAFCDELTDQSMARPDYMGGLAYFADTQADWAWAEWDGTIDPQGAYRIACLVAAPDVDGMLIGDVFQGSAVPVGGGGSAT